MDVRGVPGKLKEQLGGRPVEWNARDGECPPPVLQEGLATILQCKVLHRGTGAPAALTLRRAHYGVLR